MARKKRPQKKTCDAIQGEPYHAQPQETFSFNWMDMFCFPYMLCARFWDCCVSLCAGTNQCLVYFMLLQWCMCKVARCTTPDPLVYPYYFYMFCQVFSMTAAVVGIWFFFGQSFIIPYLKSFYQALLDVGEISPPPAKGPGQSSKSSKSGANVARMAFRKYCFRKSEIFDVPPDATQLRAQNYKIDIYKPEDPETPTKALKSGVSGLFSSYALDLVTVAIDMYIQDKLF